jgi:hypothetical protein
MVDEAHRIRTAAWGEGGGRYGGALSEVIRCDSAAKGTSTSKRQR